MGSEIKKIPKEGKNIKTAQINNLHIMIEFEKRKEEIEKIKHDMYILFAASYVAPIVYLFIIGIVKMISSL